MTLQQLRDLVAVVSHGGFRAAARSLNVSQAGLTKSLARLEEEYGVSLLERTAKGLVLSKQGQEFLPYAQAVLHEVARAEDCLRKMEASRPSVVVLGVSFEPSIYVAPSVLFDFARALPNLTVHVTQSSSSELLAAIRDNRVDLAIMRMPAQLRSPDLRVDVLYSAGAAIVGRKGHSLAHVTSVVDLVGLDWVVVGDPTRSGQEDESIRELFVEHGLEVPHVVAVCDSLFDAVSKLLKSDCVARLPSAVLEHNLTAGLLTEIRVEEQRALRYDVALVSKASRVLTREAKLLGVMLTSFARVSQSLRVARVARV